MYWIPMAIVKKPIILEMATIPDEPSILAKKWALRSTNYFVAATTVIEIVEIIISEVVLCSW